MQDSRVGGAVVLERAREVVDRTERCGSRVTIRTLFGLDLILSLKRVRNASL